MSETLPTFTVAVATHDRAPLLRRCLQSLEALDYPRELLDVVVVDDGSTDDTPAVLADFQANTDLRFSYIRQANAGGAVARNRGLERATGALIAFTDDDCAVVPGWLKALSAAFTDDRVGGAGGPIHPSSSGVIIDYMTLHEMMVSDIRGEKIPASILTANACYRRDILLQIGGFDEQLFYPAGSEDIDLSWRVTATGYVLAEAPEALVWHEHRSSLRQFVRTAYTYARGHRRLAEKHSLAQEPSKIRHLLRAISPRYYAYRAKTYRRKHATSWDRAIRYACLDLVWYVSWWYGYWS